LREWAYAKAYETSDQRRRELSAFLFRYNWRRPHMSLGAKPPVSRLSLSEHNLEAPHLDRLVMRAADGT
jgi:transposase InsO family protein